jgi:hypothetical protein
MLYAIEELFRNVSGDISIFEPLRNRGAFAPPTGGAFAPPTGGVKRNVHLDTSLTALQKLSPFYLFMI